MFDSSSVGMRFFSQVTSTLRREVVVVVLGMPLEEVHLCGTAFVFCRPYFSVDCKGFSFRRQMGFCFNCLTVVSYHKMPLKTGLNRVYTDWCVLQC